MTYLNPPFPALPTRSTRIYHRETSTHITRDWHEAPATAHGTACPGSGVQVSAMKCLHTGRSNPHSFLVVDPNNYDQYLKNAFYMLDMVFST